MAVNNPAPCLMTKRVGSSELQVLRCIGENWGPAGCIGIVRLALDRQSMVTMPSRASRGPLPKAPGFQLVVALPKQTRAIRGVADLRGKINIQPIFAYMTVHFRKVDNADDLAAFDDGQPAAFILHHPVDELHDIGIR